MPEMPKMAKDKSPHRGSSAGKAQRDKFTVVLESIYSDFRAFDEKLDFMDKHLDGIDGHLDGIESRLDNIESELVKINTEIAELKTLLSRKADVERLANLEIRVKNLEALVKSKRNT